MAVQFETDIICSMKASVEGSSSGTYKEAGDEQTSGKSLSFTLKGVNSSITAAQAETLFDAFFDITGGVFVEESIIAEITKREVDQS